MSWLLNFAGAAGKASARIMRSVMAAAARLYGAAGPPAEEVIVWRPDGSFGGVFGFAPRDAIPENHFPYAAYVVATKQTGLGSLQVLMLNHGDASASWPGCWDLPGGAASREDCDGNPPSDDAGMAAAARECREETGLNINACAHFRDAVPMMLPPDQHGTKAYTMVLMVPVDLGMPAPTRLEPKFRSAEWLPIADAIACAAAASTTPGVRQKNDISIILEEVKKLLVR